MPTPVRTTIRRVIRADGLLIRPDESGGLIVHCEAHDGGLDGQPVPRGAAEEVVSRAGPAVDGLNVVVTHSGVTLAPALSELVAAELLDGSNCDALAPFRPGRFAT